MKKINFLLCLWLIIPGTVFAWSWQDLWQTPAQQAHEKSMQAVSSYRSGNYDKALQYFTTDKSSDGQYNAGNAAAYLGQYKEAVDAYDQAIALNANNQDAIANREIVKKLLKEQQQNQQQNQSSKNDKQNQQNNNLSQESQNKDKQQSKDQAKPENSKPNQQNQKPSEQTQQPSVKQQPKSDAASTQQKRESERSQQLLRRLADEPGGLLQRKFQRDYMKRHGIEVNDNQGAFQ